MVCPECKNENQNGNFCANCGAALKEKCRECNKMEKIGRKVCETKLARARERLSEHQRQKVDRWRMPLVMFSFFFGSMVVGGAVVYTVNTYLNLRASYLWLSMWEKLPIEWKLMLPVDFSLIASLIWLVLKGPSWPYNALERAKEEFFRLNPQDAELLKKAEEK